jgi:hypothetical protein
VFDWLNRRRPEPPPRAGRVPEDLVLAINAAAVTVRGEPDPETGEVRVLVRVPGVGAFIADGTEDMAARIGRTWDVEAPVADRAAKLLAGVVAREVRDLTRRRFEAGRPYSWVHDW